VKIVADESVDQQIVDRLRADGHDVLFVAELDPGIDREAVLLQSRHSNAILLTADACAIRFSRSWAFDCSSRIKGSSTSPW